jgi:hypothetical protein
MFKIITRTYIPEIITTFAFKKAPNKQPAMTSKNIS